jgi:hypothetical protein
LIRYVSIAGQVPAGRDPFISEEKNLSQKVGQMVEMVAVEGTLYSKGISSYGHYYIFGTESI